MIALLRLMTANNHHRLTDGPKIFFVCLSLTLLSAGCGSDNKTFQQTADSTLSHQVGYRVISFVDSSRTYRPDVGRQDELHFRPIDIDIWYPSQPISRDSVLRFGYFLQSLQDRANFLSAPQTFDGLPMTVAKSFCEGAGCSRPDLLLRYQTNTFNQPRPIAKQFPLILYMASFGSMGYENYLLFESLARQGYVVASVSSIGRYPGEMTMKNADLMEQVRDASEVLNRLKKIGSIDTTRVGVIGYSWGGLAGCILAMQRRDINAIVSLDGSEFHHYGQDRAEDKDFNEIVNTPSFRNTVLSIPYLRLESNPQPGQPNKDSVYNFLAKIRATKRVVKIDSAGHEDFSSLPSVVRLSGKCPVPKAYQTISALTTSYFDRNLKKVQGVQNSDN